jgi:hypothetical protein
VALNRPRGHLGVRATPGKACTRRARRAVGLELESGSATVQVRDDRRAPPVSRCGRERVGGGLGCGAALGCCGASESEQTIGGALADFGLLGREQKWARRGEG